MTMPCPVTQSAIEPKVNEGGVGRNKNDNYIPKKRHYQEHDISPVVLAQAAE